ncbi:MAG: radical SAM protein [Methanomassiliicoccales archaeon]|nr:radical SAM protein [Methanomassiliicoccales archaeon]
MRSIDLYRPGSDFPSVSVTGTRCELMCQHCRGRYLEGMEPVATPEELMAFAKELEAKGAPGFLLSGGCDRRGKVPLAPFVPTVREIKRSTSLQVNLHPGLVSGTEAEELASSGADRLSFDLTLDPDTLNHRMHLDRSPQDIIDSFKNLCRAAPGRVAPHVLLGAGKEERELEAVRLAGKEEVPCIILLSLLGQKVDDWEGRLLRAVAAGVGTGRPVLLGCLRPRGRPDVEIEALRAGAAGLACPAKATAEWALKNGGAWHRSCCALHR